MIDKLIADAPRDDFKNNVRINISAHEYLKLLEIIKESNKYTGGLVKEISEKQTLVKKFNINKTKAVEKATQARSDRAKKHIIDAIDYIKRNDIKLNQSQVVKYSKCSVNTVRKYNYLFED
jgi:hypothetical protein